MNISTQLIVSNSDMIKNYKACREKAEMDGKIIIFKNNQPDAVLLPIKVYENISVFIEYMESIDEKDLERIVAYLSGEGKKKKHSIETLIDEIEQSST